MSNSTKDIKAPDKPHTVKKEESKKSEIVDKVQESLESGAQAAKEKISEVAEKSIDIAGEVYDTAIKGVSTAFDTGSKMIDDLTKSAQEYVDRFNQNMEIRKLSEERKELATKLGHETYVNYKVNKKIPQKLTAEKNIIDLMVRIEKIDKEIVKLGKKLGQ